MQLDPYAKRNMDGSYSVSLRADELVAHAFVDFYSEETGAGYQRHESTRGRRGREIAHYIQRCVRQDIQPTLFELTANARHQPEGDPFDALDEHETLGILTLDAEKDRWLSIIDGGTRLLGIETALTQGLIQPDMRFDLRVFVNLSPTEEIAQFLLINEKQKRVRTDLSLRVVQRANDNAELTDREQKILATVVPDSDSWKFQASRLAGQLNTQGSSPWRGLIQMPNDSSRRPVKMQAYWSSLKPLLTNDDLMSRIKAVVQVAPDLHDESDFLARVLINFWNAIRDVNPRAFEEPKTTVLWGSIGVNSCHLALAPVLLSVLTGNQPIVTREAFRKMMVESQVSAYAFWYTRPGKQAKDKYPGEKGEAPTLTGAANYSRLGKRLEKEWRAALHSNAGEIAVIL